MIYGLPRGRFPLRRMIAGFDNHVFLPHRPGGGILYLVGKGLFRAFKEVVLADQGLVVDVRCEITARRGVRVEAERD